MSEEKIANYTKILSVENSGKPELTIEAFSVNRHIDGQSMSRSALDEGDYIPEHDVTDRIYRINLVNPDGSHANLAETKVSGAFYNIPKIAEEISEKLHKNHGIEIEPQTIIDAIAKDQEQFKLHYPSTNIAKSEHTQSLHEAIEYYLGGDKSLVTA